MKTIKKKFILPLSLMTLSFAFAIPALALDVNLNTNTSAGVSSNGTITTDVKLQTRITTGKDRANREIDRRISALNELKVKINAMVRVSTQVKASLSTSIQKQIDALVSLKAKIASDTDLVVLKTDIQSITGSYRIFTLIIPQGHITATVDSLKTTADIMTTFSSKLSAYITTAGNTGTNTSAMTAALADMNIKIADAKVNADSALALVANLTPDNGNEVVHQSNNAALKSARAKLQTARADLHTAREDAQKIVIALRASINVNLNASSTTSVH